MQNSLGISITTWDPRIKTKYLLIFLDSPPHCNKPAVLINQNLFKAYSYCSAIFTRVLLSFPKFANFLRWFARLMRPDTEARACCQANKRVGPRRAGVGSRAPERQATGLAEVGQVHFISVAFSRLYVPPWQASPVAVFALLVSQRAPQVQRRSLFEAFRKINNNSHWRPQF